MEVVLRPLERGRSKEDLVAEMRTAVATYTRALQEQAFDSDVPRALAALRRAGFEGDLRVALESNEEEGE